MSAPDEPWIVFHEPPVLDLSAPDPAAHVMAAVLFAQRDPEHTPVERRRMAGTLLTAWHDYRASLGRN